MINYKEYIEAGLDLQELRTGLMPQKEFEVAHKGMVLYCHDIFVQYEGGILLVHRDNEPARNVLWPLGGRVMRGMDLVESSKRKVREESGLELVNVSILGVCRTYFHTDPFRHGHGTDSVNAVLLGKGLGNLTLDGLHNKPVIVKPSDCTVEFMESLSPYVRDFLALAMKIN
jgi:hypothetical protein